VSYDLEVRSDAEYSRAVPDPEMAAVVESLPGVTRTGQTSFVLDRLGAGIFVNIDLFFEAGEDEPPAGEHHQVNSAALSVAYPLLDKTGPVALEMAFQIAERLGWSVYDPQGDCDLTRESSASALALQASAGSAAQDVLARVASEEPSLGSLFLEEMWNHKLLGAAGAFVAAASAALWLVFSLGWTEERFDKYGPWVMTVGGVGGLWLKSLGQALLRRRRARARP
jgi:hypothetical protein